MIAPKLRIKVYVVAVLLAAATLAPAWTTQVALGATPSASGNVPTLQELDEIRLRSLLGLNSDLDKIRQTDSSSPIYTPLGIAMTATESADMVRREGLGQAAAAFNRMFENSIDYAGSWVDQAAGGVLHVSFTTPLSKDRQALINAQLPDAATAVVSTVQYSLVELTQMMEVVTADNATSDTRGLAQAQSVLTDIPSNRVVVGIANSAPAGAESAISNKYNTDMISTVRQPTAEVACGSQASLGPRDIRSGNATGGKVISTACTGAGLCTLGVGSLINASNQRYAVTAGHCSANGPSYVTGALGSTNTIGQVHASSKGETNTIRCDCLAIGVLTAANASANYLGNGNTAVHITSAGFPDYVGQLVCESGATTYDTLGHMSCGPYQGVSSYTIDGFTLNPALQVSAAIMKGDSGGPLIGGESATQQRFYGIVSGYIGSTSYYSEQSMISSRFGSHYAW